MRFSIDVVYVDRHLRVIGVQRSLPPFRLGLFLRATHSVLELSPGAVDASGTRLGDLLRLDPAC